MRMKVISGGSKRKSSDRSRAMKQSGFREFSPFLSGGIANEVAVFFESAFAAEDAVGSGSNGGRFREEEEGRGCDAV